MIASFIDTLEYFASEIVFSPSHHLAIIEGEGDIALLHVINIYIQYSIFHQVMKSTGGISMHKITYCSLMIV